MSRTIYGVREHGGVGEGEELGTLANHQFILSTNRALSLEENIQRFALLPDDYVVRDSDGAHISMGQLRRSLRDSVRKNEDHPAPVLAMSGHWPNMPNGFSALLPVDVIDYAELTLAQVLRKRQSNSDLRMRFEDVRMKQHGSLRYVYILAYFGTDTQAECIVRLTREYHGWAAMGVTLTIRDIIGDKSEDWRVYSPSLCEKIS